MFFPSGLKSAHFTPSFSPKNGKDAVCTPDFTSQIRTVLSSEAVATNLPSRENRAELTVPECPENTADWSNVRKYDTLSRHRCDEVTGTVHYTVCCRRFP